jgi:hypothetical protein
MEMQAEAERKKRAQILESEGTTNNGPIPVGKSCGDLCNG